MVRRDVERRGVGVKRAGVDDAAHSSPLRGLDDVRVLSHARPWHRAGDQEQTVHARERLLEGRRAIVVGEAGCDAEIGGFLGRSNERNHVVGSDVPLHGLDDEAPEVARGGGDGDGHLSTFRKSGWTSIPPECRDLAYE